MTDCSNLISKIKEYNPQVDVSLIEKAFEYAKRLHEGQVRLSGDAFITHPLAVAEILADVEQDQVTIAAGLLHDVIEDGKVDRGAIAEKFGEEIAYLVEGVTKLGQIVFESREVRQAENFRKMLLAMGEDIRVIVIKLADRLHNMQTLQYLPKEKQIEISIETREIFAPLAHRIGIWRIKWELEDLPFRYLEPDKYEEIRVKVAQRRAEREVRIKEFISKVKNILSKVNITSDIYGRPKHFFSIYRKMVEQNLEFEDLYDLLAVRIIVDTVKECYAALGLVHAAWRPIPGRFTDYIAMPKLNGYQSLHTTVIGEGGFPVEVQIRTKEMHKVAEYGVAAHWRYKEGGKPSILDQKMEWLRSILDWQKDLSNAKDFMENLKIDLFTDEVFVFTPKGAVQALPVSSTPVDLAYMVHTEVGHRCTGAKVNGKIVPLDYKLKNGDIVEIITGKIDNPSMGWLNFVKTSSARTKIKSLFKKQKSEENLSRGRASLNEELEKMMLKPSQAMGDEVLGPLLKDFNVPSADELLIQIGYGEISPYVVAKKARGIWEKHHGVAPIEEELVRQMLARLPASGGQRSARGGKKHIGVQVVDASNILIRFSKCCRPLPKEEITGFVTKGKGVTVHKSDCPNVAQTGETKGRYVKVEWNPGPEQVFPVEIEVEAFDRVGVLHDILEKIAETKTNVGAANVKTKRGSMAILKLIVDVRDVASLSQVIKMIKSVSDVYNVSRKIF
ncbi:MAG: bifunctional (p)ppGpp synthetase/guanosine-3',5'-bis(diphosphate) 3'-pyrophosphohydrolase [bacterium]